ncbi:4Fe-4S ferredoxin, iron-sulfur binding domain protein [Candidatus Desulforudis audaxviator MP104C]|uniref:4Fe-4S ferredoxin, iron-sulfur binding domain protein n=1 Tax=Desulforudis audaxviator (strain MP104C) TaxID=477974 RepID=B1I2U0_DESAP|nr:4Fe-4S dicluster domain-containing protein [Candidatus Desulforudis audaxviator]ACA59309.1 4Fe-4S ferredoxin, iron-sulfur binding domain protein [Candidatus Desulforudis audaxviator MP104C]
MPPRVDNVKCDGCRNEREALCELICPGNLMALDTETNKGYCRSPRDCWDCMSCTKICPKGAIETRIPYQLGYYSAKLVPFTGTGKMTWTVVDIDGKVERFTFRTRNK